MPRQARLDLPGTLHYVTVRGIEGLGIVSNHVDRNDWVARLGNLARQCDTAIFAWSLLNDHAHILLKSGPTGLSSFMRRFQSGYANAFNRRHSRRGYLFQDRYKSKVCEMKSYFLELVRHIHLNPLRSGLVRTLGELDYFSWSGHAVILGNYKNDWQNTMAVLHHIDGLAEDARKGYRDYIERGLAYGNRTKLFTAGSATSSNKGSGHQDMHPRKRSNKTDAQILGSPQFIKQIRGLAEAGSRDALSSPDRAKTVEAFIAEKCRQENISVTILQSGNRRRNVSSLRSYLAHVLVNEFGLPLTETGRRLGVSSSAIAQAIKRGHAGK